MKHKTLLSIFALFGLVGSVGSSAAAGTTAGHLSMQLFTTPAAEGSSVPRVTTGKNGLLYLSWVEPSGKGNAFRYASWQNNRWSAVHTIAEGTDIIAAVSSEPGLLELPDGMLVAQWLIEAKQTQANHIVVAVSHDGRSWTKPVIPYRDSTPGEHMYVSLFAWPSGGAGIVWLDPRGGKNTSLMQTTIDASGKLGPERAIDADVCSCCPTSTAITSAGPVLMYRGRTTADIRDMHVTSLQQGTWRPAHIVHADNWKLTGCPTNSGVITAQNREVAVTWFTGASGHKQVKLAFSQNAGSTFAEPLAIDDAAPVGRASVALLPDGSAITSWVGASAQASILFARKADIDSQLTPPLKVAQIAAGEKFGFPFVATVQRKAVIVWTVWEGEKALGIRAALVSGE